MKRELTCTNYFIILEKIFSREHTKNLNANVRARPDVTFWAVVYHFPIMEIGNQMQNHKIETNRKLIY